MQGAQLFQIDVVYLSNGTKETKHFLMSYSIFQEEENSSFSGFCANVAKQAIVYCEFNCQTDEVTH